MQEIKQLTTPKNYEKFDKKITDKEFLLGRFYDATLSTLMSPACTKKHHQIKKFPKTKGQKLLEAQSKIYRNLKQKKQVNVQQQKSNKLECFETYLPLNKLWCSYMTDLILKESNQETRQLKLLRSDFHGANITVVHSKNPTMIGLEGIVVKQTLKTFQIFARPNDESSNSMKITGNIGNTKKIILKSICIFLVRISDTHSFIVNGNSLVYRPSDRIKHKFKFKTAETLNHEFLTLLSDIKNEEESINQSKQ